MGSQSSFIGSGRLSRQPLSSMAVDSPPFSAPSLVGSLDLVGMQAGYFAASVAASEGAVFTSTTLSLPLGREPAGRDATCYGVVASAARVPTLGEESQAGMASFVAVAPTSPAKRLVVDDGEPWGIRERLASHGSAVVDDGEPWGIRERLASHGLADAGFSSPSSSICLRGQAKPFVPGRMCHLVDGLAAEGQAPAPPLKGILKSGSSARSGWRPHFDPSSEQSSMPSEFSEHFAPTAASSSTTCRRRRRRKASKQFFDWYTYNTSGTPQLVSFVDHLNSCIVDPESDSKVLGCAFQEVQRRGVRWQLLRELLGRRGWSSFGSESSTGPGGGDSAGVLLAAPRGPSKLGVATHVSGLVDISPVELPGRLTAAVLNDTIFPCNNCLMLDGYFVTNESLSSPSNTSLLNAAAEAILAWKGPWMLSADFNSSPEEAYSHLGSWLSRVGGRIRAPTDVTCRTGRVLDFVIMSTQLDGMVHSVTSCMDFTCAAHRPVRVRFLRLSGNVINPLVTKRSAPRKLPRLPPQLPCRALPAMETEHAQACLATELVASQVGLDCAYHLLLAPVEKELAYKYDLVDIYIYMVFL